MRQPLRRRLSLSILFLKLCLFSSYSFKRIPSSSLMTFFFSANLPDPSPSLSFTESFSAPPPLIFLISLCSCTGCFKPTTEMSLDCLCHSELRVVTQSGLDCRWGWRRCCYAGQSGPSQRQQCFQTLLGLWTTANSLEFLSTVSNGNGRAFILPSGSPHQLWNLCYGLTYLP